MEEVHLNGGNGGLYATRLRATSELVEAKTSGSGRRKTCTLAGSGRVSARPGNCPLGSSLVRSEWPDLAPQARSNQAEPGQPRHKIQAVRMLSVLFGVRHAVLNRADVRPGAASPYHVGRGIAGTVKGARLRPAQMTRPSVRFGPGPSRSCRAPKRSNSARSSHISSRRPRRRRRVRPSNCVYAAG
jgi:hypothetical protein